MQVDDDGGRKFKVYDAAPENTTDQKNPALRRLVSLTIPPTETSTAAPMLCHPFCSL